jgi:hypothetical protein
MKKIALIIAATALAACGGTPTIVADTPTPTPTVTVTVEPSETEAMPNPVYLLYIAEAEEFSTILGDITTAVDNEDYQEVSDQYINLGRAAQAGLALESTGNPEFDYEWDAAMDAFYNASEKGYIGIEIADVDYIKESISYMEEGSEHIRNVTAIIKRDGLV